MIDEDRRHRHHQRVPVAGRKVDEMSDTGKGPEGGERNKPMGETGNCGPFTRPMVGRHGKAW